MAFLRLAFPPFFSASAACRISSILTACLIAQTWPPASPSRHWPSSCGWTPPRCVNKPSANPQQEQYTHCHPWSLPLQNASEEAPKSLDEEVEALGTQVAAALQRNNVRSSACPRSFHDTVSVFTYSIFSCSLKPRNCGELTFWLASIGASRAAQTTPSSACAGRCTGRPSFIVMWRWSTWAQSCCGRRCAYTLAERDNF